MTYSLNEVEATAKKAARGAGYPWGLAEEASKAARWLCAQNIDGCSALASLLTEIDGRDLTSRAPAIDGARWNSAADGLCPIATGAAIADRAHDVVASPIHLGRIDQPVLLISFAALVAQQKNAVIEIVSEGAAARTDGMSASLSGSFSDTSSRVTIGVTGEIGEPNLRCQRASPTPDSWAKLLSFAHRTYAPATDESRAKGAGAGLSEND